MPPPTRSAPNLHLLHRSVVCLRAAPIRPLLPPFASPFHHLPQMKDGQQFIRVLITSAAGRIGQAVAHSAVAGVMLGFEQPIYLHLYDDLRHRRSLEMLERTLLEGGYPLLDGVSIAETMDQACEGIYFCIAIADFATTSRYSRGETMKRNHGLFRALGRSLVTSALLRCGILVVSHPACFGALTLQRFAPTIESKNITSLTRGDHDRAQALIAAKIGGAVGAQDVHGIVVWGINSSVQHCDVNNAFVDNAGPDDHIPMRDLVTEEWLRGGFKRRLQRHGYDISRDPERVPYVVDTVSAICNQICDWYLGIAPGVFVSAGIISDGQFNVPPGVLGSFPARLVDGEWLIDDGFVEGEFMEEERLQAKQHSHDFYVEALRVVNALED